jgi:hypothetical protein
VKKKNLVLSILSVVCVILFPCFFLYLQNTGIAIFSDFLNVAGKFLFVGLSLLGLSYLIFRKIEKAALFSNVTLLFLLYFALIEKAIVDKFPMLYYWHIALICLFLIFQIGYLIYNKVNVKLANQINQVFLFIFAGLILFNGIISVPKVLQAASNKSQKETHENVEQANVVNNEPQKELPNVYYFVFDEYAGLDSIQRYCNYDNSAFFDTLEDMGFVVSRHSLNYSFNTETEIPNLLQLNLVNSPSMTKAEKRKNADNPYLIELMKEHGYTINVLDMYNFIDLAYTDLHWDSQYVSTYGTFEYFVMENTAFYPIYDINSLDRIMKHRLSAFGYAERSSKIAESNLFTIGLFWFPHEPFIFDEHGNKLNDADISNLRDTGPYLGQYKYASTKILELATEIIKNDPNSIIILQSDHGYRYPDFLRNLYGIYTYDMTLESPYMRNILNAVYYQGQNIDIDNYSGINTLRTVLNKLLNTNFEMIEQPK